MNLVYCSSPTRLINQTKEILDFVASQNKGPLHPFNALPYEYFEGGKVGRKQTLEFCLRLMHVCDEFWLFGLSEGTLLEAEYFFKNELDKSMSLKVLVKNFDPEWEKYAKRLSLRFNSTIKRLDLI